MTTAAVSRGVYLFLHGVQSNRINQARRSVLKEVRQSCRQRLEEIVDASRWSRCSVRRLQSLQEEARCCAAAISEGDTEEAVLKESSQGNSRDSGREECASSCDQ